MNLRIPEPLLLFARETGWVVTLHPHTPALAGLPKADVVWVAYHHFDSRFREKLEQLPEGYVATRNIGPCVYLVEGTSEQAPKNPLIGEEDE